MSAIPRLRPLKLYRVVMAFGPYVKGATIQPTGVYRDVLLSRKLIEEVPDEESFASPEDQQPALLLEPKRGRKQER